MSAKIDSAMLAVMRAVTSIGKNKKNVQQGYSFRGIDEVYNELHGVLADNGIYMTTEVMDQKREERQTKSGGNLIYSIVTCKFHFRAEDGSEITSTIVGEGMDSGDKATNKALSAAQKYCLLQAFCIPTNEPKDSENDSPEVAPKKAPQPAPTAGTAYTELTTAQMDELRDACNAATITKDQLLAFCRDQLGKGVYIETVEEIMKEIKENPGRVRDNTPF